MRTIKVSEAVYQALAGKVDGFETPDDVLRRVLGVEGGDTPASEPISSGVPRGRLLPLIRGGVIAAGDQLMCRQPRKGLEVNATVTEDGGLQTSKGIYGAPSPALKAFTGTEIDGWAFWIHVPTQKSLRALRGSL